MRRAAKRTLSLVKKMTAAGGVKPASDEGFYGSLQHYAQPKPRRDVVEEVMKKVALAAAREGRHR